MLRLGRKEDNHVVHVMRIDRVETCWGTRNCCVVLNLSWRLSSERDGRGNGSVAGREICPLLNFNWVGAWNFPAVNQLQICAVGRKGTRALHSPHREDRSLSAEGGGDFKRERLTSCVKGTCELPSSTISPSGKFPYPSICPCVKLEELAPTRSVEANLHTGLGWDCFQNTIFLLVCLWVGGFQRETPKAIVIVWSWTRHTKRCWLFAARCPSKRS